MVRGVQKDPQRYGSTCTPLGRRSRIDESPKEKEKAKFNTTMRSIRDIGIDDQWSSGPRGTERPTTLQLHLHAIGKNIDDDLRSIYDIGMRPNHDTGMRSNHDTGMRPIHDEKIIVRWTSRKKVQASGTLSEK